MFNKRKFDALAAEQKAILKYGAEAASSDMLWKALDRYSTDLEMLRGKGVQVLATPKPVLDAQLAAWDKVIASLSADPFFKKVVDSQKAWCKRTLSFERVNEIDGAAAYDHFFKA
jgi:TRAP-type mannitol/chloroaromatic compound transport system substrate-binding protein